MSVRKLLPIVLLLAAVSIRCSGSPNEPDGMVLELLRHIRGAVDHVRDDLREMKQRIGNLESQYANMSNRLDRMDVRIERIERRLDLADA